MWSRTSCSGRGTTSWSKRCSILPSDLSTSAIRAESVAKFAIHPPAKTATRVNVCAFNLSHPAGASAERCLSLGVGFLEFALISAVFHWALVFSSSHSSLLSPCPLFPVPCFLLLRLNLDGHIDELCLRGAAGRGVHELNGVTGGDGEVKTSSEPRA